MNIKPKPKTTMNPMKRTEPCPVPNDVSFLNILIEEKDKVIKEYVKMVEEKNKEIKELRKILKAYRLSG